MENLSSYVRGREGASEINYFEVYDFVGALDRNPQLHYITHDEPLSLWDHEYKNFIDYQPAGITRTPLNRGVDLSVNTMTVTFLDPDFRIYRALTESQDDAVRNGKFSCRRVYYQMNTTPDWRQKQYYRHVFVGKLEDYKLTEDGIISAVISDAWIDWNLSVNKRTFSRMCGYLFKGGQCKYSSGIDFCDKTLLTCEHYGNGGNFGGFKNIDEVMRGGVPYF